MAALSWLDDRGGLSPAVRLLAHAAAVTVLLVSLAPDQRVLPAFPLVAERVLMGLAWLWFINLFNFMDGIDGIAGGEAVAVAAGYLVVAGLAGVGGPLQDLALIVAAATAGFLIWNWHPARVFMGDTGSIALGFLLGWLMIDLACRGLWAAAAILPLYFVADATLTLGRRLARGEKPWQPHRQHFYQRAVLGGATPAAVVLRVSVANAALMALAVLSIRYPLPALVGAAAVVGALLVEMQRLANGGGRDEYARRSCYVRSRRNASFQRDPKRRAGRRRARQRCRPSPATPSATAPRRCSSTPPAGRRRRRWRRDGAAPRAGNLRSARRTRRPRPSRIRAPAAPASYQT